MAANQSTASLFLDYAAQASFADHKLPDSGIVVAKRVLSCAIREQCHGLEHFTPILGGLYHKYEWREAA
ncbi:MAG: hypothetical protein KDK39_11765 [Leptospiraceae bacterium]|nr:hypothetical protein [Leptospiraceae bacterium]